MKIYVIMKGEYSERHIVTVTLDKEKADKLVKYHSSSDSEAWIEEYETDDTPDATLNRNVPVYCVTINKNGSARVSIDHYHYDDKPYESKFTLYDNQDMNFNAFLTASDEEHALKIARDRRAKMIAERFHL